MAHFAKLNADNAVMSVHVVDNINCMTPQGEEREEIGVAYLQKIHGPVPFVQTSYNGNFRKNYAGVGYTYDAARDAFIAPQPFPSWTLNEDTCRWEALVPYPTDGGRYEWDEASQGWVAV